MLVIFVLVALASVKFGYVVVASDPIADIRKINQHLEKYVETSALDANIAEARTYLRKSIKKRDRLIGRRPSRTLIQILQSVVTLEDLVSDRLTCDHNKDFISTLMARVGPVVNATMNHGPEEGGNRLQQIICEAARVHSDRCLSQYPILFAERYSSLDSVLLWKVGSMFKRAQTLKSETTISGITMLRPTYLLMDDFFMRRVGARILHQSIMFFGKYQAADTRALRCREEGSLVKDSNPFDMDRAKALLLNNLIQPCEYYEENFRSIFESINFDMLASKRKLTLGNQLETGLAYMTMCKSLLNVDRDSVVDEFLKLARVERDLDCMR